MDHIEAKSRVVCALMAAPETSIVKPLYVLKNAVKRRVPRAEAEFINSSMDTMTAWLEATELPSRSRRLSHSQNLARARLWKVRLKVLSQRGAVQGNDVRNICRALDGAEEQFGQIEDWKS